MNGESKDWVQDAIHGRPVSRLEVARPYVGENDPDGLGFRIFLDDANRWGVFVEPGQPEVFLRRHVEFVDGSKVVLVGGRFEVELVGGRPYGVEWMVTVGATTGSIGGVAGEIFVPSGDVTRTLRVRSDPFSDWSESPLALVEQQPTTPIFPLGAPRAVSP